jgi:hypothetical protein
VGMSGYLTMRAYKDGECSFWCGFLGEREVLMVV